MPQNANSMPKILIVDDSSFQRRLIRRVLGPLAEDTIEACDGLAALAVLQHETPDVILLDLLMPELDGFGVLEQLLKIKCPIPRVVLTADVQETALQRCMDLGAFDVVHKPPSEEKLHSVLARALAVERVKS